MTGLDFSYKWIKWILGCLKSASVSILVNGNLTLKFILEKDLKQYDPLASFMFLIVVERLVGVVREIERKCILEGVEVGRHEIRNSML